MPKRRHYRRRGFKLKLRKETIYTVFGLGLFLGGLLLLASFTRSQDVFIALNDFLNQSFGFNSFLFPVLAILFGFLFLRVSILSRPNVAIGYLIFFVSILSLTKSGSFGLTVAEIFQEMVSAPVSLFIFIAGVFIGLIVLFDTSIDEIFSVISLAFKNVNRLFPAFLFNFFKKKKSMVVRDNKQMTMTIKGGEEKKPLNVPKVVKREPELISDKLVTNILSGSGIWKYPPLSLLPEATGQKADRGDIKKIAAVIEKTLQSFGIDARVAEVNLGPAVTQYALEIALGTKVSKITSLANDLALATEAPTGQIRIEAPIPGRNLIGIEIPNRSLEVVAFRTMLASSAMQKAKSKLTVAMGLDVSGNPVVADLARMPHILVAGTTGSGKSVLINSIISSLLFRGSPTEVKLILIDPKRVEFSYYNGIPHLLTPVIVEAEKILSSLKWATGEMDRRYKLFAEQGVRNIEGYNELSGFQALPYIVVIIDELADLMIFAPVEVEDTIARLAQMARATGIHLVIATQRPSVNVITGLIKANVPCRIAFNVSSMIDSRVIIDGPGAEKLLGRGDMLYIPPDQAKPTRIQGAYISEKEVKKLVEYLKSQGVEVSYTEEIVSTPVSIKKGNGTVVGGGDGKDAFFEEAIRVAARILDQLEEAGVVGPGEGSKPRDVLTTNAQEVLNNLHEE